MPCSIFRTARNRVISLGGKFWPSHGRCHGRGAGDQRTLAAGQPCIRLSILYLARICCALAKAQVMMSIGNGTIRIPFDGGN